MGKATQVTPVLVLGAASWNRMIHVAALPQGVSATVFEARETEGAGSTGVGKAMALAGLGHDVTLQCALGRDDEAARIEEACRDRGIAMIVEPQDVPTPRHLNIMDTAGGRYSIFLEGGAAKPVLDTSRLVGAIAAARTIFLSLSASSKTALPFLDGVQAEVLLDLHDYDGQNPWYDDFIARADVVQFSDVALPEPEPVISRLLAGRARQIVLTRGADGAEIVTEGARVHIPACPARLRDSNGAGDAFSAALWHAQAEGMDLSAAGRFAAAAAAFAIEDDTLFPADLTPRAIAARAG